MISEKQIQEVRELWFEHAMLREGYRTEVYLDTLGKPTVGIGHLVLKEDNLKVGDVITGQEVIDFFDKDSEKALNAAIKQAQEIGVTTTDFIVALVSVNFQLGTSWNKVFSRTYAHLVAGRYETAIANLRRSKWARQTPVRVSDFIKAIKKISTAPQIFIEPPKKPLLSRIFKRTKRRKLND